MAAPPPTPRAPSRLLTLKANPGGYTSSLAIAAAGVAHGLVYLPVTVSSRFPFVEITPPQPLQVQSPDAAPAEAVLRISSRIWNSFGRDLPASSPFEIVRRSPAAWLSVSAESGLAPAEIRLAANPAGLNAGLHSTTLDVRYTDYQRFPPQPATRTVPVQFRIGPAPAAPALLVTTPRELHFRLTRPEETQTRTIRLESTGDALSFQVGALAPGLTASPASGTTPAEIAITLAGANRVPGRSSMPLPFRAAGRDFLASVIVDYTPDTHVAALDIRTLAGGFGPVAPGALFQLRLPPEIDAPASFRIGDIALRGSGSEPLYVLLQMPFEIAAGDHEIDALDAGGRRVARGRVTVAEIAPAVYGARALKQDGSVADDMNPVLPGEIVLLRITGQGQLDRDGKPRAAIGARVGGKAARVISAEMNETLAGVLDVWVEVPTLYAGDHVAQVVVARYHAAAGIPLRVAAR